MRYAILTAVLASSACSSQPTTSVSPVSPSPAPLAQVANYAGEWTVTYHVDSCIGRYCYISHINREQAMTLRLVQMGDHVTGAFLSDGLVTDVEGLVDAAGRLSLAGAAPSPDPYHGSLELLQFDAALDDAFGMSGRLQYQSLMPGERSSYSSGATGPIVRAARLPLAITSFAGTWEGFFTTTQCVGARYCLLDDRGSVTFDLDDQGGQVSGTITFGGYLRLRVAGRASGGHVDLRATEPSGGEGTVARLSRSATGRITGTITVNQGWTTDVDLLGVALAPVRP
jgi:hypothetical protein